MFFFFPQRYDDGILKLWTKWSISYLWEGQLDLLGLGWKVRFFFPPHCGIGSKGVRNPGKIRAKSHWWPKRGCGWIPPGFPWRRNSKGVMTVDSGFRETCHFLAGWLSPYFVTSHLCFHVCKIGIVVPASFLFCCVSFFLNLSQSFPIFFHLLLLLIICPPEDNINSTVVDLWLIHFYASSISHGDSRRK